MRSYFQLHRAGPVLVLAAAITAGFLIPPAFAAPGSETPLESGWTNPPVEARLRAYWWWLNGNVTTQAITRDLEEMKTKGFGGAVIIDANGAAQEGNSPVPHGPAFFRRSGGLFTNTRWPWPIGSDSR